MLLVEACAGSAALTRHLLGIGKIVGFMGSKDGYAEAIAKAWGVPRPTQVWLNDPGMWGSIWPFLYRDPQEVARHIRQMAEVEPRRLFDSLKCITTGGPEAAAKLLCRLAGTHGGGEVGGFIQGEAQTQTQRGRFHSFPKQSCRSS